MNTDLRSPRPVDATRRAANLLWSWAALLLTPLSFFVGFVAAHVPYAVFGYEEGTGSEPWWLNLLASVIGVGILWLPVGASLMFGRRALAAGNRWAWIPVGVGLSLTAGALALIVASTIG